jgi:hypothetical protein
VIPRRDPWNLGKIPTAKKSEGDLKKILAKRLGKLASQ